MQSLATGGDSTPCACLLTLGEEAHAVDESRLDEIQRKTTRLLLAASKADWTRAGVYG